MEHSSSDGAQANAIPGAQSRVREGKEEDDRESRCFDSTVLTLTHAVLPPGYTSAFSPLFYKKKIQVTLIFSVFYVQCLFKS